MPPDFILTQDFTQRPTKITGHAILEETLKEKLKSYYQNVLYAIGICISTKQDPCRSLYDSLHSIANNMSNLKHLGKRIVVVAIIDGISDLTSRVHTSLKEFGYIMQMFDLKEIIRDAKE